MTANVFKFYSLLMQREQMYSNFTDDIWDSLPWVTEGIIDFLDVPKNETRWDAVEIFGTELIIVVAINNNERVQYHQPGSVSTIVLNISIPLTVIELGSANLITEHLHDSIDVRSAIEQAAMNNEDDDENPTGVVGMMVTTRKVIH